MGRVEAVHTETKTVNCNGSSHGHDNSSCHPLVYLNMGNKDSIVCPYCDRYFTTNKLAIIEIAKVQKIKSIETDE